MPNHLRMTISYSTSISRPSSPGGVVVEGESPLYSSRLSGVNNAMPELAWESPIVAAWDNSLVPNPSLDSIRLLCF